MIWEHWENEADELDTALEQATDSDILRLAAVSFIIVAVVLISSGVGMFLGGGAYALQVCTGGVVSGIISGLCYERSKIP